MRVKGLSLVALFLPVMTIDSLASKWNFSLLILFIFIFVCVEYSGADLRGRPRLVPPPVNQNFFNFMELFNKFV